MAEPPKNHGVPAPHEWPLKAESAPVPGAPAVAANDKGKVVHDDRGNATWDLGLDTARVKKLTTSQLLKKLDLSELSLLDEEMDLKAASGGGFQPYEPARGAPSPKPVAGAGHKSTPQRDPFKTKR